MSNQTLKSQTVRGMGWSAIDNVAKLGISFLVGVVLARLLSPDEYGLIGILTIFISVFNAIVDSGFSNALIRKKNATDVDFSTVFYTNLALSVVMAGGLFLLANPIAVFFEREELVPLTRVLSIVVIINALAIVQRTRLTRNIDFKTQIKITIIATIISGAIGIAMAVKGFGVWALVWQQISSAATSTVLLWVFNRWIPKRVFSKSSFREMWSFGWKLLASALIDTTWKEIYQVVIGKCYTPATLGLYTRAQQFASIFSSNLSSIVGRVSYPVLSKLQDDIPLLREGYRRIIRTVMLAAFVLMLGMVATAKALIICLIGNQWIDCVPMLQIVCISMMFYPLHSINLNILQVSGRSDLFLKLEIIKKCVGVGPVLLGIFVGIYWMLVGSVFTGFVCLYLNSKYSKPLIGYGFGDQLKDISGSFSVAITMAAVVWPISLLPLSEYAILPIQFVVGAAIAILLCEWKKLPEYVEVKGIVMNFLNSKLRRTKSINFE